LACQHDSRDLGLTYSFRMCILSMNVQVVKQYFELTLCNSHRGIAAFKVFEPVPIGIYDLK
jgi:hypothetical protein